MTTRIAIYHRVLLVVFMLAATLSGYFVGRHEGAGSCDVGTFGATFDMLIASTPADVIDNDYCWRFKAKQFDGERFIQEWSYSPCVGVTP